MGNINLVIDNTLIQRVDSARGKQPRVSWIRDAIDEKLAGGTPSILDQPMVPHPTVSEREIKATVARHDPVQPLSQSAADIVKRGMR